MGTKPHQLLENRAAIHLRELWPASRAVWRSIHSAKRRPGCALVGPRSKGPAPWPLINLSLGNLHSQLQVLGNTVNFAVPVFPEGP